MEYCTTYRQLQTWICDWHVMVVACIRYRNFDINCVVLHIIFKLQFVSSALHKPLSGNPSDVTVNETKREDVVFTCSFSLGSVVPPPSSVKWLFVNQTNNQSMYLAETGITNNALTRQLQLPSVDRSNCGTYQCVITNEFGSILSSPATLTVQCKLHLLLSL